MYNISRRSFNIMVKNRLKEILSDRGIKQVWLAEKVGIDKRTLSNIISNKYNTSLDVALKIAYVLDLTVNEIFELEDIEKVYTECRKILDK
jgi:DNA-binding XRE family transcriptional regulator